MRVGAALALWFILPGCSDDAVHPGPDWILDDTGTAVLTEGFPGRRLDAAHEGTSSDVIRLRPDQTFDVIRRDCDGLADEPSMTGTWALDGGTVVLAADAPFGFLHDRHLGLVISPGDACSTPRVEQVGADGTRSPFGDSGSGFTRGELCPVGCGMTDGFWTDPTMQWCGPDPCDEG